MVKKLKVDGNNENTEKTKTVKKQKTRTKTEINNEALQVKNQMDNLAKQKKEIAKKLKNLEYSAKDMSYLNARWELSNQIKSIDKERAKLFNKAFRLMEESKNTKDDIKDKVKLDARKGKKAKTAVKVQSKVTETEKDKITNAEPKIQPISLADMPKAKLMQDTNPLEVKNAETKLKITPTITLVPHVKKNGTVSSNKVDIQLMDADGKIFKLTKKMVNDAFERGDTNCLWQTYVAAYKKGRLKPEMIEETFFKGQVNLGDGKKQETQKQETKPKEPQAQVQEQTLKLEKVTVVEAGKAGVAYKKDENSAAVKMVKKEKSQVKVEETTKDISNKEKQKTKTITPDGVMYSIDANGGINATKTAKFRYLMPKYNSDDKEVKDGTFHAYEKDGQWHCGNSSAKYMDMAIQEEETAMATLAANNSAYNDLKRESAKRNLTPEEKKFMSSHEAALQERGIKRCNDGVLERNTTKEADYNKNIHAAAQKLNLEIVRGEKKSTTFTAKQTEADANVMQQQKGNSI